MNLRVGRAMQPPKECFNKTGQSCIQSKRPLFELGGGALHVRPAPTALSTQDGRCNQGRAAGVAEGAAHTKWSMTTELPGLTLDGIARRSNLPARSLDGACQTEQEPCNLHPREEGGATALLPRPECLPRAARVEVALVDFGAQQRRVRELICIKESWGQPTR